MTSDLTNKWYVLKHRDDHFFGKPEGVNSTTIFLVASSKSHAHFLARYAPADENTWYTVSKSYPRTYEVRYKYKDGRFVLLSS